MSFTPLDTQFSTGIKFFCFISYLLVWMITVCFDDNISVSNAVSFLITFALFFALAAQLILAIIYVVFTKIISGPRLVFCTSYNLC